MASSSAGWIDGADDRSSMTRHVRSASDYTPLFFRRLHTRPMCGDGARFPGGGLGQAVALFAEGVRVGGFDSRRLVVRQLREFPRPGAPGERALVLAQETEKQVGGAVRHVDDIRDSAAKRVMRFQEARLGREIDVYRPLDALMEEFRVRRGVEVSLEIAPTISP